MTAIQVFQFHTHQVRVAVADPDHPEWIAADVCVALELANSRQVLAALDDDEKGVQIVDTPGGPQEMATVTEPGLYSLILRSRKPAAKDFKRWVTHEVLPSIRKTGSYGKPAPAFDFGAMVAAVTAEVVKAVLPQVRAAFSGPVESRAVITLDQAAEIRAGLNWIAAQCHRAAPCKSVASYRAQRDLRLRDRAEYPKGKGNGWVNLPASKLETVRRALREMRQDVEDIYLPSRQTALRLAS